MRFLFLMVGIAVVLMGCAAPAAPTATPTTAPPMATNTPAPPTATITPLPTATATPLPSGIFIDSTQQLGKVSPLSFGTNHGPWAFLTVELWDKFKQSGISFIRFPGGNWGDENDLSAQNINDYMTVVKLVNAEPQITVRLRGGSPEFAVSILKYTQEKGYKVKYWSIGNEPSLYAVRYPEWTTEKYNVEWRKFAQALKAQDPTILLIGPDIHQFNGTATVDPKDSLGRDWLDEFLKANGDLVDVVAVHRYPFPQQKGDAPPAREKLFASAREWDETIPRLRERIQKYAGRDIPVGVTEFNSDWVGKIEGTTTADSVPGALYIADVLGRLMRQRVDIISQFTLQMNAVNGSLGIFDHYDPRPVYFVYALYKQFGDELVFAGSDDVNVPVYAAKRADGTLTVVVLNLTEQEVKKPLVLQVAPPQGKADVWLFDATHKAVAVDPVALGENMQVTLPPSSMSLFVIPAK